MHYTHMYLVLVQTHVLECSHDPYTYTYQAKHYDHQSIIAYVSEWDKLVRKLI